MLIEAGTLVEKEKQLTSKHEGGHGCDKRVSALYAWQREGLLEEEDGGVARNGAFARLAGEQADGRNASPVQGWVQGRRQRGGVDGLGIGALVGLLLLHSETKNGA